MQLKDLSDTNQRIMLILKDVHSAPRKRITELTGLTPNQVSPALNRLEAMGFVEHSDEFGAPWTITKTGYALFGLNPPIQSAPESPAPEPEPEPEPATEISFPDSCGPEFATVPEPEPEPAPGIEPVPSPFAAAEMMTAMEVEFALEQARRRLRHPAIPARAARIYRGILEALPEVLVKELHPITAIVDAHG
ncbi:MAG: hypothetical protein NHG36_20125 [Chromatiaceae bacterium]|nr:hypothetical protein [Candidatus Thioaporhodococcus sediminis]